MYIFANQNEGHTHQDVAEAMTDIITTDRTQEVPNIPHEKNMEIG